VRILRRGLVSVVVVLPLVMAAGCGSSLPASAPGTSTTTSTRPPPFTGTLSAWLTGRAEVANDTLNSEQLDVISASRSTSGIGGASYFHRLHTACTSLRRGVAEAARVPAPPDAQLARAWSAMVAATGRYAAQCLAVTDHPDASAIDRWNRELDQLNDANGRLDTALAAARSGATTTTG
jgi:hypothetical protein